MYLRRCTRHCTWHCHRRCTFDWTRWWSTNKQQLTLRPWWVQPRGSPDKPASSWCSRSSCARNLLVLRVIDTTTNGHYSGTSWNNSRARPAVATLNHSISEAWTPRLRRPLLPWPETARWRLQVTACNAHESRCDCQLASSCGPRLNSTVLCRQFGYARKCWQRALLTRPDAQGERTPGTCQCVLYPHCCFKIDEDHTWNMLYCAFLREENVERIGHTRRPSATGRQQGWCAAFSSWSWRRGHPTTPRHLRT